MGLLEAASAASNGKPNRQNRALEIVKYDASVKGLLGPRKR